MAPWWSFETYCRLSELLVLGGSLRPYNEKREFSHLRKILRIFNGGSSLNSVKDIYGERESYMLLQIEVQNMNIVVLRGSLSNHERESHS